jgi:hypothetical protein
LAGRGRDDLNRNAVDGVVYTDDGTTLYVHILPKPAWIHLRPGRAYVLAFADKKDLATLAAHRELLKEAGLLLHDDIDDVIHWLDG